MSSITFADNKLGGRLMAACDAIAAGHLNRAAGILAELSDELNVEATQAGLLSDEGEVPTGFAPARTYVEGELVIDPKMGVAEAFPPQSTPAPKMTVSQPPADLQSCMRNAHTYGAPDANGWRHCQGCGMVNVAPPDDDGPYDMSARQ